jgi:hypothetical protein
MLVKREKAISSRILSQLVLRHNLLNLFSLMFGGRRLNLLEDTDTM